MPSARRHYRITRADALNAHEVALRNGGGLSGIRSLDQVLSSIGRPYSGYHRRIENKAAALLQSVAMGHGFVDGNKRCAVILTNLLLDKSGYSLQPVDRFESLDDGALESFVLSVVADRLDFDEISAWFVARIERSSNLLWETVEHGQRATG